MGAAIVFWEKLRRFRPLSETEGKLKNMFRCKKTSWQADLRSELRKFVFHLVAMEILFPQENTEIRGFLLGLEKLEAFVAK